MSFGFILDTREHHITKIFKERSINFPEPKPQLDLGDILITNCNTGATSSTKLLEDKSVRATANKLLGSKKEIVEEKIDNNTDSNPITLVIERKTFTDLKASMADGRYHEQKSRYLQLPKGTMFYILEDNDPQFKSLDYSAYLGMYTHTIMRDGITVFVTRSMEETVDLLLKMKETVEEFGLNYIDKNPCTVQTTQIKKKKAKGKEVYIQQLQCFPGISKTKASSIADKYECMSDLMSALKNESFKVKGVGPVLIAGMKDGLFPQLSKKSKLVFDD
jgi:ERCC4-type nuclease